MQHISVGLGGAIPGPVAEREFGEGVARLVGVGSGQDAFEVSVPSVQGVWVCDRLGLEVRSGGPIAGGG